MFHRIVPISLMMFALVACAAEDAAEEVDSASSSLVTCTAWRAENSGTLCGRGGNGCTAGSLYKCTPNTAHTGRATCVLQRACPFGCQENPSPDGFKLTDSCYAGPAPLVLSSTNVTGGDHVTASAKLALAHPRGATVYMTSSNPTVAKVPFSTPLASTASTANIDIATSPVSTSSSTQIWAVMQYSNANFYDLRVVSPPVTLNVVPPGTPTCTPTTCAAQTTTCGTIPDGCGGTLTCGPACTTTPTCVPRGSACSSSSECCNGRTCKERSNGKICD